MTHRLSVRPLAKTDIADAARWYESHVVGLGAEYLSCVDATLRSIARNPELHAIVRGSVRRAVIRRFPYGAFYVVEESRVVVLAVLHTKMSLARLVSRQ
jgi:plasmid stabilization system protein ParE